MFLVIKLCSHLNAGKCIPTYLEIITNFFIDTKSPGIEIQKIETLGHRGIGTTQVFYTDFKVSDDCVLGEVDDGWRAADKYLWYE